MSKFILELWKNNLVYSLDESVLGRYYYPPEAYELYLKNVIPKSRRRWGGKRPIVNNFEPTGHG